MNHTDSQNGGPVALGPERPTVEPFRSIVNAYVASLTDALGCLDCDSILRIVARLRTARDAGATVFIAGNGGSAATASHWVNDLAKATRRSGRRPFRVIGLADNMSWFSALANDEGYDRVFSGQLENLARPGDLLMVISASGNSPNLLQAVDHAKASRMTSIALVGFDGGALLNRADESFWIPTPQGAYGLVESVHSVVCDMITSCLIEDRAPEPVSDR